MTLRGMDLIADARSTSAGLDSVEHKYGGGKIDPAKQRGMNEKITDFARDKFEKASG